MTEEKPEQPDYPWPFGGRIPLYENGIQIGWVGPLLNVGSVDDAVEVEVVISEDGSLAVDGKIVQTVLDSEDKSDLYEWFSKVLAGEQADMGESVDDPFRNFKFTVEGADEDA